MDVDTRLLGRVWDLLKSRDARPRPRAAAGTPTVSIVDYEDAPAELLLYYEIGYWGITAQDVAYQLRGHRGDLHVRINSPGGDVFDGYAIYNMLAAHDGLITVTVEGLAASAASFIAMAGDQVRMSLASQMMIHDASGVCIGNAQDMREWADVLDSVSGTVAGIYAERGGTDADTWREFMRAETWYAPQEAVDAGLADAVITPTRRREDEDEDGDGAPAGPPEKEPAARWDLTVFQYAGRAHAPAPTPAAAVSADTTPATTDPLETDTGGETAGETSDKDLIPAPRDAEPTNWAALVGGLLTAPAPASAPSTVDELLGDLQQKGWRAA